VAFRFILEGLPGSLEPGTISEGQKDRFYRALASIARATQELLLLGQEVAQPNAPGS
jgi:hypothetical protein